MDVLVLVRSSPEGPGPLCIAVDLRKIVDQAASVLVCVSEARSDVRLLVLLVLFFSSETIGYYERCSAC